MVYLPSSIMAIATYNTMPSNTMIAETSFIIKEFDPLLHLLKVEAIDRIESVVDELPKYKQPFQTLIDNFTVEDMLYLMNIIFRDNDFKASAYYKLYNNYFDEIEDLIHRMHQRMHQRMDKK